MSLFQLGDFSLTSGQKSGFKIECETLTEDDWACLAWLLQKRVPIFGEVRGVPRGGLPLAQALAPYASDSTRVLLVDDVWTTGGSMRQAREELQESSISCAVAFARTQCPSWVTPIFQMA